MAANTSSMKAGMALGALFGLVVICSLPAWAERPAARIVVDGGRTGQTWEGFGASAVLIDMFDSSSKFGEPTGTIPQEKRKEILQVYYEDLGMSRARFFPQGYEPVNDNDDPFVINPDGFLWHGRGTRETRSVNPYCDEHLVMGREFRSPDEPFVFFPALNVWEGWLHMESAKGKDRNRFNPAMVEEYAEHALAATLHIKEAYGYELSAWSLFNEPVHSAKPTKETVLALVLAVGRRFEEAGLNTKLTICDDAWPEASAEAIEYVLADEEARDYVGSVSYHRYRMGLVERSWAMLEKVHRGEPLIARPVSFYSSAARYGKSVWMTELVNYGGQGLTQDDAGRARANHIIDEINNGKANAFDFMLTWGPPKEGKRGSGADSRLVHMIFEDGKFVRAEPAGFAQWVWHLSRHIRPGDVQLTVSSTDPLIKAVAFRHDKDHTVKLVVINNNLEAAALDVQLKDLWAEPEVDISGVRSTYGQYRQALRLSRPPGNTWSDRLPPLSITTYVLPLSADDIPLIESLTVEPRNPVAGEKVSITARIWDPLRKVGEVRWFPTESRSRGESMHRGDETEGVVQWTSSFTMYASKWPDDIHVEIVLFAKDGNVIRKGPNGPALQAIATVPRAVGEATRSGQRGESVPAERSRRNPESESPHGGAEPEHAGRADRETSLGQKAAEETAYEKALDISYGPSKAQAIDAYYMPSGPARPAVIFIHGGGWNSGSRKNVTRFLKAYETAGLACVAVGYRLSRETPHPAQIEDVMAAVRFVTQNAETWNIDPARLATVGGSAGGQLAMWVAYQDDAPELAAVVSVAGQPDLTQEFLDSLNPELKRNNMLLQLFGVAGSPEGLLSPGVQEEVRRFSPITHMTADDPPTAFIVWDEGPRPKKPDPRWGLHHAAFAERGKQRLDELGVEAKLVLLDQASADFGEQVIAEEVEFLKKHLLDAGEASGS